jgi:hypothetical protein
MIAVGFNPFVARSIRVHLTAAMVHGGSKVPVVVLMHDRSASVDPVALFEVIALSTVK